MTRSGRIQVGAIAVAALAMSIGCQQKQQSNPATAASSSGQAKAEAEATHEHYRQFSAIDLQHLTDEQQEVLIAVFNSEKCVGVPGDYTLAECLNVEQPNPTYVSMATTAMQQAANGLEEEQIKTNLAQMRTNINRQVRRLRQEAMDEYRIYEVNTDGASFKGPEDAPINIVEFSDFQCPFCSRANKTLEEVLAAYPGQIRVAFMHFPLSFHKQAKLASQAALAAGEQDKFWEMHDKMFANQRDLQPESLNRYARELGLDMDQFQAALNRADIAAQVDKDMKEASRVGVSGTPTFFVNGKKLRGAKPFAAFKSTIDAVLEANKKG